ncbi:MAG: secondary thiamine-phosphate synthase enzyme YjbQ [Methanococcaceae archaeon]
MEIIQKEIRIEGKPRGFHLITNEILRQFPEIKTIKKGIANIFIKHTSASLTINENADPDVRGDLERHFNKLAPENAPYYEHNSEGSDDMPAHIKSTLIGASVSVPVTDGEFNLGTWQGIYLCEHRNHIGKRKIVITVYGETE